MRQPADKHMDTKKGLVLCVDDEPNILRSLRWLLQKEFDVEVASSGQDGLAMIRKTGYDVVVSDQRMPGMMGSEFLREVRKLSPGSMRILLTGYSDMQAILRSVNEGEVFRFINKPWVAKELLQLVGEAAAIARAHPSLVPASDAAHDDAVHIEGECILVVDDDPGVAGLITEAIGSGPRVSYANNVAEAVAAFEAQDIGIIISNMRVGNVDATRMLKVLKQQHPDIVVVVYTDATDAVDVIGLINQAQIFRFLPKPVKPTMLRIALAAATVKRKQLKDDPSHSRRHAVQALGAEARASLVTDIKQVAQATRSRASDAASFLHRLGGGLMRMFGHA